MSLLRNLIGYLKLSEDEDYDEFDELFELQEKNRELERAKRPERPVRTVVESKSTQTTKKGIHVYDFSGCKCIPYFRIDQMLAKRDRKFSETLLTLIDQSGKKDSDIYKSAGIDRKHFSKIRKNPDYMPKKATVFAFAIALELSVIETEQLLKSAGYSLSNSYETDIIIKFFLQRNIYNRYTINETLAEYQLECI
ncbi:MAG: hypothetical protein Q4G58_06075 [bacterium]|nr:hypothetical protein [bacterium]